MAAKEEKKPAEPVQQEGIAIDMAKIAQIESSGNPMAFNKGSKARGLHQITPIVLKEWNQMFPKSQYSLDQLFNPEVNTQIANWYMHVRIPQMLNAYGMPLTVDNVLGSYNAGIGNIKKGIVPLETQNYIKKYAGGI